MRAPLLLLCCCFLVQDVPAANVLYVAPIASPSLQRWNRALAMGLRDRGHNVTMLSHDAELGAPQKNFTLILLEGIYEKLGDKFENNIVKEEINAIKTAKALFNHVYFCCDHDLNTTGFQRIMDYPQKYKFDIIVFDASYGRCFYPLVQRFQSPPAIAVTPYRLPPVLANAYGSHLHTAYVPYFNTEYSTKMTFFERFMNFFYTNVEVMYRKNSFSPRENKLVKDRFGEETPPLRDFERNISLLLPNVDFVMDFPMALPPNIIPVGGLHLTAAKALPNDLQKIVTEAKHGVIYFSLGALLRSDKLIESQSTALLGAFAKLPHTILWKFEGDSIPGLPKNVIIRKNFPQNDILGHKNTKLFITHGGILSTQEAMYHAVPVVGIPFTADQRGNVRRMERRQIAKVLTIQKNFTADNVYATITEVLNNPIYAKNVRTLARRFRDQPQQPLQRAIFWIEYVMRHGTAEHLVSPARDMDPYATANLDILGVCLSTVLTIYLSYLFLPGGIRLAFGVLKNHIQAKQ